MATSDFPHESDASPAEAAPRVEPPRIVNLPSSFDMDEFPSEVIEKPAPAFAADDAAIPAAALAETPAATVIEFPTPPPESLLLSPAPAAIEPAAASRMLTLADILEERGGMDWRESIALVHKLCDVLKRRSQRTPVLLEPRNIQVTPAGDVSLLSEQLGGDPLVMQIGRLLRTMLMGRPSPPELRLLLAQATFELPIFESVEDIDAALTQIERADDPKPQTLEIVPFSSPLLSRMPPPKIEATASKPAPAVRPIKPPAEPRRVRARIPKLDQLFSEYGAHMVAGLAAIIAAVALFIAGPSLVMHQSPAAAANRVPPVVVREPAATTGTPAEARPAGTADPAAPVDAPITVASTSRQPQAEPAPPRPAPHETRAANTRPERPPATVNTRTAPAIAAPAPTPVAPRESERRATALIAQGQASEAAMVFDSLLLANPLYEPRESDLAPESLTAFRNSQKLLLPVLAQRGYDRAKAALAAGDADRAIASAREAAAILERPAAAPAAHLRDDVQQILDEAGTAKATADEIVYTKADAGIVPPRALSRQFPATTPNGVPAHRVGTLEMIIGKEGTVEFVRLHTPLNRYHERMIVSAAKAWLYRPATKAGKPVRFRLTVTINLPENGTY
jgi:hypothetical protein